MSPLGEALRQSGHPDGSTASGETLKLPSALRAMLWPLAMVSAHGGIAMAIRDHGAWWSEVDQAAGSLLIEEAGGRITDLAGQPLDFTSGRRLLRNMGVLASNGLIHRMVLEAVQGTS
jgi:fructose-1,6-bisphosphatase/inositol monophosphatase family enzyme